MNNPVFILSFLNPYSTLKSQNLTLSPIYYIIKFNSEEYLEVLEVIGQRVGAGKDQIE